MILSAIPYFFYDFNEKEQAIAVAEIAERKAAKAAAAESAQIEPQDPPALQPEA